MSLGLRQTKFQLELVNVEELTGSQWTYIVSPLGGLHASYIELSSELFV